MGSKAAGSQGLANKNGRVGVQADYKDAGGLMRSSTPRAVLAVEQAMAGGWIEEPMIPAERRTRVERRTGEREAVSDRRKGGPIRKCVLPGPGRGWGIAVQLYALRSLESWGMGDLNDLYKLATWSVGLGASVMLINPLHAPKIDLPQNPSPYFPSSRLYANPLYIHIEDVPGAKGDSVVEELGREGRKLNGSGLIERDEVYRLKMQALEHLFSKFDEYQEFFDYCHLEGQSLSSYATYCAINEVWAGSWKEWPAELQDPGNQTVLDFARGQAERVRFHKWLQWLLEVQLAKVGKTIRVIMDVAVGIDGSGADGWSWQKAMIPGVAVGCPPDLHNRVGQNWGVAAFNPERLRSNHFTPWREVLRRLMKPGGGVRIDHVMGLFRLWLIPDGSTLGEGVYVRYPAHELLNILAEESERKNCFVVGEDMGTVELGVRMSMHNRQILSYRAGEREVVGPTHYPQMAMAALSTHDQPTLVGLLSGNDARDREHWGVEVDAESEAADRRRVLHLAGSGDMDMAAITERIYASLAASPCQLVVVSLDDLMQSSQRPNLPGNNGRPNWSIPLPMTLEQLEPEALPWRIAQNMGKFR